MRKAVIVILALITALMMSSGYFLNNKEAQAVSIPVNVKDISRHGLSIIGPSDPSFQHRISAIQKGKDNAFPESLKPYSIFLENKANKAVVAYSLKWEMVKADGTVVVRGVQESNPRALMDGGVPGLEYLSVTEGCAIKPGDTRFICLESSLASGQRGGIYSYAGEVVDADTLNEIKKAMKDENLKMKVMMSSLVSELQSYVNITVSIDGAFFEDGTFVGPDSTQFFVQVQTALDAKRDLLKEIVFSLEHKRALDEIFADLKEWAEIPDFFINNNSTTTDYYNYFKKVYAEEILRMKSAMDSERAITLALQPLRKLWPQLKKI